MLLIIFAFSCQQKCQCFSIAISLTIFTDGCQCFAVGDMYDLIAGTNEKAGFGSHDTFRGKTWRCQ